jgi:hypothetical protein
MAKNTFTFTDEQKTDFINRYNDGTVAEMLAKEVGCSVPTMLRNLRTWGAVIRKKGRPLGSKNKAKAVAESVEATVETPVVVDAAEQDVLDETVEDTEAQPQAYEEPHRGGFFNRVMGFVR